MRALFKLQTAGSLFGIPIRVMPAVMLLVLFFLASAFSLPAPEGPFPPGASPPPTPNLPFVFGLFVGLIASLLAHEIAHAWVAKQRGFRVVDIIIWPLGGMARVEGLSESPRNEALVAFAGPLANLLLALVFCVIPGEFAHMLLLMNLVLGIGNLVPIFPLDGGRVLRAFLAHNAPLASATKAAIQVSNWALLIFVVVAFQEGWFFLGLLLGAYLWFAGRMEMVQILVRQGPAPAQSSAEVWRRAWSAQGAEPSVHAHRVDPDQPSPQEPHHQTPQKSSPLESFKGNLDEFFRGKK